MKVAPFLAVAVAFACVAPPSGSGALPESAANVWRISVDGGSASAVPVAVRDGRVLFLTARHVAKHFGVPRVSGAIVESRDRQRRLQIVSYTMHPTLDLAMLNVKTDGKQVALVPVDATVLAAGQVVYTIGYPGPVKRWMGHLGYMGMNNTCSAHNESGMSGGAVLDGQGALRGILVGHGVAGGKHFPEQTLLVPMKSAKVWLKKHGVL